ncbi:MAG: AAA family ATPase [Candidatus Sericytochromatia bacterium]|nr:AAA family ATPase [Candidatus Tanganyikabacteria bacterium]
MAFVNREAELAFLRSVRERGGGLVVVYGKRRVGKTALVRQFTTDVPHVYFLADKAPESAQLQALSEQVGLLFEDEFVRTRGFGTWTDAFRYLAGKGRVVLVIDEFPYLIETNAAIPSIFQKGWDEYLQGSGVLLILLGSSIGMMETEVLGYRSPLFGRRTGQLLVTSLSFWDLREFCACPPEELMGRYAILGGMPAYWLRFDPHASLWANIAENVLQPEAYLYGEPEFILREELREPRNYFAILRAISLGKTRPGEIVNETGLDKNLVGKYLSVLTDLRIVRREVPVTEWSAEKSKRGVYLIDEPFFRFWFRFVFPNRSFLEERRPEYVLDHKIKPALDLFVSQAFEDVCRAYVRKGWLEGPHFEQVGRWWTKEAEIDVVALAEDAGTMLVGEAKWSAKPVGIAVLEGLERKAARVPWRAGRRQERYVLFSRGGFTRELRDRARREGVRLVDLADLVESTRPHG